MNPTTSSALNVPQTQNTAPVLEYRCLYTPDLKRKQKRWQDGRLKFHTFNKRVMVYDERSNFVGDTHWKGADFGEGEELELERGGILVEVGDCIGKRDQDLFELVDKRVKDREERNAAKVAQGSPIRPSGPGVDHLRPKTLNEVIGTPTGHFGRAMISNLSPFEQKQRTIQDENAGERPAKRRKQIDPPSSRSGYAQNLMGATLTLSSSRPPSTATIRYEPLRRSIQRPEANTIDLTSGEEEVQIPLSKAAEPQRPRSPPRIQKRKFKRSPPSKSGYASNLTGAALSLGTPSSFTPKGAAAAPVKVSATRKGVVTGSSSPDDVNPRAMWDSLESSKTTSGRARQLNTALSSTPEKSPEVTKAKQSRAEQRDALSTSRKESLKPVPKPASGELPTARINVDRPVAALRIKARAPRKMMMLMELPGSRSSAPTNVVGRNRSTSRQPSLDISIEKSVELLQVVEKPTSIFRTEDERPSINLADLSSSPVDSDIDHQTIDALLSRKSIPGREKTEPAPDNASSNIEMAAKRHKAASDPKVNVAQERDDSIGRQAVKDPEPAIPSKADQSNVARSMVSVKRIIPNPATRGQSVQALASKTLEAVASALTSMPPPSIVPVKSRPEENNHAGGSGPWSRESFDLFGTWKPPGKERSITS